jgi:hypothetical protein
LESASRIGRIRRQKTYSGSGGGVATEEMKRKNKRERSSTPLPFAEASDKTYPMGVLVALAPEPETFTRITPD